MLSQNRGVFHLFGLSKFPLSRHHFRDQESIEPGSDCFLQKEQGVTDEAHEHHVQKDEKANSIQGSMEAFEQFSCGCSIHSNADQLIADLA